MIYKCDNCCSVFESKEKTNCPKCESSDVKELKNELYKYELIPESTYDYEHNRIKDLLGNHLKINFSLAMIFIISLVSLAFVANDRLLLMIDMMTLIISFAVMMYFVMKNEILNKNMYGLINTKESGVYIKGIPYKVINYDSRSKYYEIEFEYDKNKIIKEKVDKRIFVDNGPVGELNLFIDPITECCYIMNA